MVQRNTTVEPWHDPLKYDTDSYLCFVGYAKDEEFSVAEHSEAQRFHPGDILIPVPQNGCGMGIDVTRIPDGLLDMVWPEEVILCEKPC